jgi:hypothetical protein
MNPWERLAALDPGIEGRIRRSFATVGWLAAAAGLVAGVGLIVVRDETGTLVLVALWSACTATLFLGAPFARAGKPSWLRIGLLFAACAAGVVFTAAVDALVAFAAVYASYVTVIAGMAKWPPSEWLERDLAERLRRRAPGTLVAVVAILLAFLSIAAATARLTDSRAVMLAVALIAWVAVWRALLGVVAVYAGRRPRRPWVPGQPSVAHQLKTLAELHTAGAISEEEFETAKERVLSDEGGGGG